MKPAMLRSGKVVTIGPDESILQAKARMTSHNIRHIPIASMLVIRPWEQNQTAIYMYLLTKNLARIRNMVEEMGDYTLLNPLKWFLRQFDEESSDVEREFLHHERPQETP